MPPKAKKPDAVTDTPPATSGELAPDAAAETQGAPAAVAPLELLIDAPAAGANADELSRALDDAPADAPAAPRAPDRPGFQRWKARQHRDATRRQLSARIKELEDVAAPLEPNAMPGAPATPDAAALEDMARGSLRATLGVVSGIGARLRGEHWKLSDTERDTLAAAWAPVIAPHLGTLASYLPVAAAVAVTAEVVWPRVEEDMRRAKLAAAEPSGPELVRVPSPDAAE